MTRWFRPVLDTPNSPRIDIVESDRLVAHDEIDVEILLLQRAVANLLKGAMQQATAHQEGRPETLFVRAQVPFSSFHDAKTELIRRIENEIRCREYVLAQDRIALEQARVLVEPPIHETGEPQ